MLILIVEGLTCICTINDILVQLSMLKKTHAPHRCICKYCFYSKCLGFFSVSQLLLTTLSSLFPITVKSKCWMEKMSTTNYCQPWSQSLRKSTRPLPPPTLSSGPPVSQSWALQPCQPVRQTHQTCRQTLQRTSSVLDVLWYVEQVAAVQNKRPVQAMPSAVHPKWLEGV